MSNKDIGFWVPPNDAHLWLDQSRYEEYIYLKNELARLEECECQAAVDSVLEKHGVENDTSFVPD